MRLIDADALKKTFHTSFGGVSHAVIAGRLIDEASTVYEDSGLTAEEVAKLPKIVRCKDCKYATAYFRADGDTGYYCGCQRSTFVYGSTMSNTFEPVREENDFCSYGEKKGGV